MSAKRKMLVVTILGIPQSVYQGFKGLCKDYVLPYDKLKYKKFPIKWGGMKIHKVNFRRNETDIKP